MPGTPISVLDAVDDEVFVPSDEVAKMAIQDTVRYQEQLLKLIFFHDEKGHKVLSVYVTVIAAMVTAAFALNQLTELGLYRKLFLGGAAMSLVLGSIFAYATAWTAPVYIPGRKPDFWLWAMDYKQDLQETTAAYLKQAMEINARNEALSNRSAGRLENAYICGVAAPFVGAATVWLAYWGT